MSVRPVGTCPLCGGSEPRLLYRLTEYSIYRCGACTLVYLWPVPDPEAIRAQFAELYRSGTGSVPELRSYYGFCYHDEPANPLVQLYERWLGALEQQRRPGRLLDVGCGTGLFMAVARRRGWDPVGVDEAEKAVTYAREHFGVDARRGEFSAFASGSERFDAITMWDIIEHTREPVALLAAARSCLAPDGIVGLSTPNQRSILDMVAGGLYRLSAGQVTAPLEKFYVDQHFLYFTPETLRDALGRASLRPVLLEGELTDLRRLTLSRPVRTGLQVLFAVARRTGLENRLFAIATHA